MAASNTSAEQLITENIDIWTSAIKKRGSQGRGSNKKIVLYGVNKLRELILELAVRGLLVPQDSSDEPASVLLEKIAAEKEQLIKDGKIKKQEALPKISEGEQPFELPLGWEWMHFGRAYELEYGNNLPQAKRSNSGEYPVYGSNGIVGTHNEYCVENPCIVVGRKGSAGALNLENGHGCWVTDVAYSITPPTSLLLRFVLIQLHTLGLESLGKGIKPGLNRNEAYKLCLAFPPEAEQPRIVAKVDELMALCDQLEQQTESSLSAHQALVETLLNTLLNADQNSFDQAWERIAQHFDVLFTTEHSIDQLKQTILQLAVMGKLVPQDPNDEPASVLLEKIAAEKEQLIKDGKIKKQKPLSPISEDEKPFELPKGWEWVRIGNASLRTDYGLSDKSEAGGSGVPVLAMGHIQDGCVILGGQKTVPATVDSLPDLYLENRDLLYNRTNSAELVGKTGIYNGNEQTYTFASYLIRIRTLTDGKLPEFINLNMQTPQFRETQIIPHLKQQCGQANVNGTIMKNMVIAIAPVKEEERIVTKLNELIILCHSLKQQIKHSKTTQLHLADAMAEQALN
jgi:type I restriction enzyme S subunit